MADQLPLLHLISSDVAEGSRKRRSTCEPKPRPAPSPQQRDRPHRTAAKPQLAPYLRPHGQPTGVQFKCKVPGCHFGTNSGWTLGRHKQVFHRSAVRTLFGSDTDGSHPDNPTGHPATQLTGANSPHTASHSTGSGHAAQTSLLQQSRGPSPRAPLQTESTADATMRELWTPLPQAEEQASLHPDDDRRRAMVLFYRQQFSECQVRSESACGT